MFIRVGIVDDHKMICKGLKNVIECNSNHSIVFQFYSGCECYDFLFKHHDCIDILLSDIHMPDANGFDILRMIRRERYNIRVIFITADDNIEIFLDAINAGVNGYILKDATSMELIKAIEDVYYGEAYFEPKLVKLLNKDLIVKGLGLNEDENLTIREKEIINYVVTGKINKEIALELDIAEGTVKNHLSSIFRKFGVSDRTQAAIFAIQNELL